MIPLSFELERMHAAGELPADLPRAVSVREAARLAALLPPVLRHADDVVEGYVLIPPRRAEPLVRLRKRAHPLLGRIITPTLWGAVCAIWHGGGGRAVYRLRFPTVDSSQPGKVRGPVDVYEDAIAAARALPQGVSRVSGWQIARLDATSGSAALFDGQVLGRVW